MREQTQKFSYSIYLSIIYIVCHIYIYMRQHKLHYITHRREETDDLSLLLLLLLLFVDRPLIQNEGQAGQMFGQPSPVCQWPTSVNTSIGKNTYNMLPKYIIRLNYYDRVSTAKAFHDTPNNKSALLLQRECQTPKSYVIMQQ